MNETEMKQLPTLVCLVRKILTLQDLSAKNVQEHTPTGKQ